MINIHIFIFRRDLRVDDNLALLALLNKLHKSEDKILPIFIFNTKQIDPKQNRYFNKNSVEFMIQSLDSLNNDLENRLSFFETETDDIEVLEKLNILINKTRPKQKLSSVSFNTDFTPFSIKRDEQIKSWCKTNDIEVITREDYTLLPMNSILTGAGTYFSVFTPFYKKFLTLNKTVSQSRPINIRELKELLVSKSTGTIKSNTIHKYYNSNSNKDMYVKGGRMNGQNILKNIKSGMYSNYDKERDYPFMDKTTKLSAYLKFGCISIREAYEALTETYGINHGLVRELVWREFYACITFNKPRVLEGQIGKQNLPFREKYDNFQWENDNQNWKEFVEGRTGFPFIDAGIRMLYLTGFCPNRLRMIVAMFAIKDLLINPVVFERWFARNLVDYDPSSNSGGTLWCSGTGCDANPYFRVFSPTLQTQRYDEDAIFIKRWIPELQTVPTKDIVNWEKSFRKYSDTINYPAPIVNHTERAKNIIAKFKNYNKNN